MTYSNPRTEILREAEVLVNGDRNIAYGDPNIDFKRIAGMWSAYLGAEVSASDVGWMMTMLKASRNRHQQKRDNYVDAAGYIACAYHCSTPPKVEPEPEVEPEVEVEVEGPAEPARWERVKVKDIDSGDRVRFRTDPMGGCWEGTVYRKSLLNPIRFWLCDTTLNGTPYRDPVIGSSGGLRNVTSWPSTSMNDIEMLVEQEAE